MAYQSTVTSPPTFAEASHDSQVKELSEIIPYRWLNGGRDSVESLGNLLGIARDHELYKKVGCDSWKSYCDKFLEDPSEAFDELIEGVEILHQVGHSGPISEGVARKASRAKRAKEIAQKVKAMPQHGGPRPIREENEQGHNVTLVPRGNRAEYRASVLRRDHPEVADRLADGEFRSVREAERAAGLVVASPPRIPLADPKAVTRKLIAQGDDFASEVMDGLRAYFTSKGRDG